jgi:ERCC4-related helicase
MLKWFIFIFILSNPYNEALAQHQQEHLLHRAQTGEVWVMTGTSIVFHWL